MPKRSSIKLFIAATSALAISSSVNSGENDLGGLKEWNTDMDINADFVLDNEAQKLADEAAKSSACIPIGEGENCWQKIRINHYSKIPLFEFLNKKNALIQGVFNIQIPNQNLNVVFKTIPVMSTSAPEPFFDLPPKNAGVTVIESFTG